MEKVDSNQPKEVHLALRYPYEKEYQAVDQSLSQWSMV